MTAARPASADKRNPALHSGASPSPAAPLLIARAHLLLMRARTRPTRLHRSCCTLAPAQHHKPVRASHARPAHPPPSATVPRVAGEAAIAYETLDAVPRASTYLLFGCAAVQIFAGVTGACGIRWLNREAICTALLVLLLAAAACGWVAAATYLWLRDTNPLRPENLLLVFGISAVADFFLVATLLFVAILYRRLRREIAAKEKSHELGVDYSDYDQRDRDANLGKKRVRKGKPREYLPGDHL